MIAGPEHRRRYGLSATQTIYIVGACVALVLALLSALPDA